MSFSKLGFQTLGIMGTPDGSAGSRRTVHTYISNDLAAVVEAGNYFLDTVIQPRLKAGDIILASLGNSIAPTLRNYVVVASSAAAVTIAREVDDDAAGQGVRAVVPTADGLTTGLIVDGDSFVEATAANATDQLTLPPATAATRGREIFIWVKPSTACKLQTPAAGTDTINNVDCHGGAAKATLAHSQFYICRQHLATGWLLQAFTNLGAVATAIVPA